MSETCLLNSQISSILDTLAAAAVRDVCKVVHDSYAGLRAQFSQSREEVEFLKRRLKLAESGGESTAPWIPVTTLSRTDGSSASAAFVVVDAEASDPESGGGRCRSAPEVEDVCSATATAVVPVASNQKLKPVTASEGQRHITCLRMGETPRIKKCTTCCSLYHCPFCPTPVFKPSKFRRLARHVKFHQNQAVQHGEFTIYECRMACRETGHFHCCYCSETITHRAAFQEHVLQCRERTQSSARRQPPTPPASAPPPPPTPTPLPELSPPPPCAPPSHRAPEGLQPPLSPALDSSAGQGSSSDVRYFFIPDSDASGSESEPESSDSPGPLSSPPTPGADVPVPSPSPSSSALHRCAKTVPAPATTSAAHTPGQGEPALTGTNATTTNTATSADIGRVLKTQCHFCGIILNRNNFILHVKRKHEDKFLEVKNQEVHRKYLAGWKYPLVQCHRCTVTLNEKSLKLHMKRRHNEEFSGEAWKEVLRKRRKVGVHCPEHVRRSFLEKVSLSVLEEANEKFLKEQEEREALCRDGRDEEVQDTAIDLDPWGEEHQSVEPDERGEEHQSVEPDERGEEHQPVEPDERGEEHQPVEPEGRGEEHQPVEPEGRGEEHQPVEPDERGEEHQPVEPDERGEEHQPVEPEGRGEEHQPVEPDERGEERQPVEPYKREDEGQPVDPGDLLNFRPVPVTRKESVQTSTMPITIQIARSLPEVHRCTTCCQKYHCPFCDASFFNPTKLSKLKTHLEGHFNRAVFYEGYTIHRCGLQCKPDRTLHYHCIYCKGILLRRTDFIHHLGFCKETSIGPCSNRPFSDFSQNASFHSQWWG